MKLTSALQQRLLSTPLRFLLIPLSWLYRTCVQLRHILYTGGLFKTRALPCRVISVGNIAVGGTGKTPTVIAIAKHLQSEGKRVAVLLRGYRRQAREKVTIVSDGEKMCASAVESGDEAYMLARQLSGIPIIVGKCRYSAGQVACERFGVDILLLDDGFQHRQLRRDVDILTVPAEAPFGNPERLLPAGTLREPPAALRRADLILLTHAEPACLSAQAKKVVHRFAPNVPILTSVHRPTHLYPLIPTTDGKQVPHIRGLKGKRVLAVCGIGNPDAFVATLRRCAVADVTLLAFADHHAYTAADGQRIHETFQSGSTDLVVTTEKDQQKLGLCIEAAWNMPIVVLAVALVITEGSETLMDVVLGSSRRAK